MTLIARVLAMYSLEAAPGHQVVQSYGITSTPLGGMRLRSHGGLADRNVYLMFSRPLNDKYAEIALSRQLRNFDVFEFVLNGLH